MRPARYLLFFLSHKRAKQTNKQTIQQKSLRPLVYLCPETLMTPRWAAFLKDRGSAISLFVVDEFHGIKDLAAFRPDYSAFGNLRTFRPEVPFMLLSGTASPSLKEHVIQSLGLREPRMIEDAIDRPLLFWRLRDSPAHLDAPTLKAIDNVLAQKEGKVMIFSKTIGEAVRNWRLLKRRETTSKTALFHSRNTDTKKEAVIKSAMSGECRVICCTSALGAVSEFPSSVVERTWKNQTNENQRGLTFLPFVSSSSMGFPAPLQTCCSKEGAPGETNRKLKSGACN